MTKQSSNGNGYEVRSVLRALDVLIALSAYDRPVGLRELARDVDLHPSTVARLLHSLIARDFVRESSRGYYVGSRTFEIGSSFLRGLSIWSQSNQIADDLAAATGETASVGVIDSGQVLYIAISRAQRDLGIESAAGTRHPIHCTSLGKAIAAHLPWREVSTILREHPQERLTERTLITTDQLMKDLALTRRRGYSLDDEERQPGVLCVGCAVFDHRNQPVAAISISGSAVQMRERGVQKLAELVVDQARKASMQLGAPARPLPRGMSSGPTI